MGDSRETVVMATDNDPESLCRRTEDLCLGRSAPLCPTKRKSLHRQECVDLFTEVDGEFEKGLRLREGEKPKCRRCDSVVLIDKVESEDDVTEDLGEEDTVDGQAKIKKVIIKCECHTSLEFIEKNKDTYVLHGTCIMQRFVNERRGHGSGAIRHKRELRLFSCMKPKMEEEDVIDHHQATIQFAITNPDAQGPHRSVDIGAKVTTLWDENEHIRHFIDDVKPGSPAENMELRVEDEIMLLNEILVVDVRAKDLEHIFAQVTIDKEFTLLTRRITNRRSQLDFARPQEVDYEYWQTKATITVDDLEDPILAERASVTQAHLRPGDIIVVADAHLTPVYVRVDSGYVKNTSGLLSVHPVLRDDDAGYNFDMLSYDAYSMKSATFVKQKIRVFRHSNSDGSKAFLYVSKSGNIKLKTAPAGFSIPSKNEINKQMNIKDFEVSKAVFLSKPASTAAEIYYLESYSRKDLYLAYDKRRRMLSLERVPHDYMLDYKDDIKFEVIPSR